LAPEPTGDIDYRPALTLPDTGDGSSVFAEETQGFSTTAILFITAISIIVGAVIVGGVFVLCDCHHTR